MRIVLALLSLTLSYALLPRQVAPAIEAISVLDG